MECCRVFFWWENVKIPISIDLAEWHKTYIERWRRIKSKIVLICFICMQRKILKSHSFSWIAKFCSFQILLNSLILSFVRSFVPSFITVTVMVRSITLLPHIELSNENLSQVSNRWRCINCSVRNDSVWASIRKLAKSFITFIRMR